MKVYRKVLVSERFPKEDGLYFTNLTNLGCYYFYTKHNKWEGLQPEWWLEEIELPSEEDIHKNSFGWSLCSKQECYLLGASFILNKLKGG